MARAQVPTSQRQSPGLGTGMREPGGLTLSDHEHEAPGALEAFSGRDVEASVRHPGDNLVPLVYQSLGLQIIQCAPAPVNQKGKRLKQSWIDSRRKRQLNHSPRLPRLVTTQPQGPRGNFL